MIDKAQEIRGEMNVVRFDYAHGNISQVVFDEKMNALRKQLSKVVPEFKQGVTRQ